MSGTTRSLAKKSSHGDRKNLKAPKKLHYRNGPSRSSRPKIVKKPPPANGNRLVFLPSNESMVFQDNCARVQPIDTAMSKADLMPFWQILETVENYDTTIINQESNKRGKIGCAVLVVFFIGIIVIGIVAIPWLIGVGAFLSVAMMLTMFFFIQKPYFEK